MPKNVKIVYFYNLMVIVDHFLIKTLFGDKTYNTEAPPES